MLDVNEFEQLRIGLATPDQIRSWTTERQAGDKEHL